MEIRFGEIIRAKREEKKITLSHFSKEIGVSQSYLSEIENGKKTNPSMELLTKIANFLDTDIEEILGIKEQENLYFKIPPLLKLVLAKERNAAVLDDREMLKKTCSLLDRLFEYNYLLDDEQLYSLYIEDMYIQAEVLFKRYMAFQIMGRR